MRSVTNQDAALVVPEHGLVALADGVGTRPDSQIASRSAVQVVSAMLARPDMEPRTPERALEELLGAFDLANDRVRSLRAVSHPWRPMTTSLLVARFLERWVVFGHVGDVRAYRLRAGRLSLRTRDHILLEDSRPHVSADDLKELEPLQSTVLTRVIGRGRDVAVDTRAETVLSGDTFVFCTNGVWTVLEPAELAAAVRSASTPSAACETIASVAAGRGDDDATVVVVRVGAVPHHTIDTDALT